MITMQFVKKKEKKKKKKDVTDLVLAFRYIL